MFQQSRPMIRPLFDPIGQVYRNPFHEMMLSTRSPLERNPQSPKGWKNRESDGIGLGIIVALQKSDGRKGPENLAGTTPVKSASSPISIGCPREELGCNWRCCVDSGLDSHETKGGELLYGPATAVTGDFRPVDFLSYCHLCRKELHGKDIYMYRGEKAFCSMECRYQQIASDEFQEKCGSEALRSLDIIQSPYADDRLFFMGITAS